jgi:hypothetical protein
MITSSSSLIHCCSTSFVVLKGICFSKIFVKDIAQPLQEAQLVVVVDINASKSFSHFDDSFGISSGLEKHQCFVLLKLPALRVIIFAELNEQRVDLWSRDIFPFPEKEFASIFW